MLPVLGKPLPGVMVVRVRGSGVGATTVKRSRLVRPSSVSAEIQPRAEELGGKRIATHCESESRPTISTGSPRDTVPTMAKARPGPR